MITPNNSGMADNNIIETSTRINHRNVKDAMVASNAVFNTYELLESIILNLPLEDIVSSGFINQTWQSVIVSSSAVDNHLEAQRLLLLDYCGRSCPRLSDEQQGFFVIKIYYGNIIICRIGGVEFIAVMPIYYKLFETGQRSNLIFVDGEQVTMEIVGVCFMSDFGMPLLWKFKFRVGKDGELWEDGVRDSSRLYKKVAWYLEHFHGDSVSQVFG